MNPKRLLRQASAPDELVAMERAWPVVRAAYEAREPVPQLRRRGSVTVAIAAALTVGAVVLSPAGATVSRLITHALGIQHASPALSSLPASGRLLVSGPAGTWTVAADGSTRRIGSWPQASWSPHGRYLATAQGSKLAAIDPRGATQWSLIRPAVHDPRWSPPLGYRVAYLSGAQLRVVAGDGTGDHLIAPSVANVAPAWRPGQSYQLAYITRPGVLTVRDGNTRQMLWSTVQARDATQLEWSGDGRYLLALSPTSARLFTATGALVSKIGFPAGEFATDGALSPDGSLLALVLGGRTDQVVIQKLSSQPAPPRRVQAGPGLRQVLWSPDGRWLLISWPAADQLVFARVRGPWRIAAVGHITRQLGRSGEFPELEGWCCTAHGR